MNYQNVLLDGAWKGNLDMVREALAKGACVNFEYLTRHTALKEAVSNGHTKVVEALIEAGANLDFRDQNGNTPLILTAYLGEKVIANLLLDAGADITIKNELGMTAFDVAINEKQYNIAKLLKLYVKKWTERCSNTCDLDV